MPRRCRIFLTTFTMALPALLMQAGCDVSSNPALGPYAEVHVIAEKAPDAELMLPLRRALEIPFRTFQQETLFVLQPRPAKRFEEVRNRKNIVFAVDLSAKGFVTRTTRELLGGERMEEARRSAEPKLFFLDDPWARGQTAAFLIGASRDVLLRGARDEGDRLRSGFLGANRRRIMKFLTFRGENLTLERRIYEEHGWTIRMPAPFTEETKYLDHDFFTMKMDQPGRILSVYWEAGHDSLPPDEEIVALRQKLGWEYGDEDVVDESSLRVYRSDFQGRPSVRLEGIWQNEKYTIGGPFRSIAFLQEENHRLFLIDYDVYAPGFPKKYYLWELESVVETFSFDPPVEQSRSS